MPLGKFSTSAYEVPTPPTLAVVQFGWDSFLNASGSSHSELPANATLGNAVALAISSQSSTLNDISGVTSSMGTFVNVNAVAPGGTYDLEWWYCADVTSAAKNLTVTSASGSQWVSAAFEISGPPVSVATGGSVHGTASASLGVTPQESGDLILVALGGNTSSSGITGAPSSPWTRMGGTNLWAPGIGKDVAWQIVSSTSSVTAAWTWGSAVSSALGLIVKA